MSTFYHGLVVYRGPGENYQSQYQPDIDRIVRSEQNIVGKSAPFTGYSRRGFVPVDTLLSADYAFTTPPVGKHNIGALAALNSMLQSRYERFGR